MQEQEGMYQSPEYTPSVEQPTYSEAREQEQRQWQAPPQQEYTERPYEEGYSGFTSLNDWMRQDEKLRPQPERKNSLQGILLFIVLACVLLVIGNFSGIIIGHISATFLATLGSIIAVIVAFLAISNWRVVTMPEPVQTFEVMEHPRILLNNAAGTITIRRGEQHFVTVAATKRASGIGVSHEKMHMQYSQQGDTLNVTTSIAWNVFQLGMRSFDLDITLPENSSMQVVNGSGRVLLQDVSGDIRLKTGSGRIEVNNVQGRLALKTGSGRVEMTGVSGEVLVTTGSGRMTLEQAQLSGVSEFKTGSGSIRFAGSLDPRGNYRFQTGSGAVRMLLPPDSSINLNGKTGSGRVVNDFNNPIPGMPRAQLTVKTGSGGISVQKSY